jgi:23S rRNA (uridine2552-2'-O)-methyltransferase
LSSRLRDKKKRHDVYHRRARQAGFAARSVYKLEEIDAKHRLLRPGQRVLDLGCRPGSWLQYAAGVVGPRGALVGLDREPLELGLANVRVVVGDVFEVGLETLKGNLGGFDVVLSDMAPDTSGVRHLDQARSEALFERALEIAEAVSSPGGSFVGKLFQGPDMKRLVTRARSGWDQVHHVKPKGSRSDSIELYVVALGRKR